jgi:formate hydrogenlyase subunit 3/multisubunit Na+/H+ antiporter MnhD subunit
LPKVVRQRDPDPIEANPLAPFRVPIALLVAVSLLLGFFPQIVVNLLVPTFRNYFSATQ